MEDKFHLQSVGQYLNRWSMVPLNGPDVGYEVLNLNTSGFQMVKSFMLTRGRANTLNLKPHQQVFSSECRQNNGETSFQNDKKGGSD